MKFSAVAAVLATATGALAWPSNVTYTTEVVTAYTTYCPAATTLAHNGVTYTVTEAGTLTVTNCPCTVTRPVTTSSVVICHTCGYNATSSGVAKPTAAATTTSASTVTTAGAGKVAAFSGAGLAGLLGIAAFIL